MIMPVRQTSLDALYKLEQSGKGAEQRTKVLRFMINNGGYFTRAELSKRTGLPINSICGRVNELLKLKMIFETGRRKCRVTGNHSLVVTVDEEEPADAKQYG
jgi:hypothetical protein